MKIERLTFGAPKLLLDFKISMTKGLQSVSRLLNYLELLINERTAWHPFACLNAQKYESVNAWLCTFSQLEAWDKMHKLKFLSLKLKLACYTSHLLADWGYQLVDSQLTCKNTLSHVNYVLKWGLEIIPIIWEKKIDDSFVQMDRLFKNPGFSSSYQFNKVINYFTQKSSCLTRKVNLTEVILI